MKYRMKKAQDILDYYCKKYNMAEVKELKHDKYNKEILKEIVEEIMKKAGCHLGKQQSF
ncbi:MAG: hypothetical protein ACLKAL_10885 [Alkaliphilus sp.]